LLTSAFTGKRDETSASREASRYGTRNVKGDRQNMVLNLDGESQLENVVLTHYTSSADAVASILRLGFFFSFRPTGTFELLYRAAGVDALEPDDKGMVCFTELSVQDAAEHRSNFGSFGIALSKYWLVGQGARQVVYIKEDSLYFQAFVDRIRDHAPREAFGYRVNDQEAPMFVKMLRQRSLASKAASSILGMDPVYLELLDDLLWVQVTSDQNQAEWRIRNPSSFGGIQDAIRAGIQSLELVIATMANAPEEFRRCCFFTFPPYALRFLIAPIGSGAMLNELIQDTPFSKAEIVELA
jgi:hypothetical protein